MLKLPETQQEFIRALQYAAELGGLRALEMAGLSKPFLKMREAKRMFGPQLVTRWIKEGLINPVKDGDRSSSIRINRIEIEAVARTANRSTYMTLEEMQADNLKQRK